MATDTQSLAQRDQAPKMTFALISERTGYNLADIAMIRHNMAGSLGCAPEAVPLYDVAVFTHQCRTLGLDPLLKQAYWIKYGDKTGLQVSIDGFRAIADESKEYGGSDAPIFRGGLQQTYWDKASNSNKTATVPEHCEVRVWKMVGGQPRPFVGEADWTEFYPGGIKGFQWIKMPRRMLAKVAEAQALRKAFPKKLGGASFDADSGPEAGQVVIEQVQTSPRPDYAQVYGNENTEQDRFNKQTAKASQPAPPKAEPVDEELELEPEEEQGGLTPSQESPAQGLPAARLRNTELAKRARDMGIIVPKSLCFTADQDVDKVNEHNVELERRIMERNGDAKTAETQEATL